MPNPLSIWHLNYQPVTTQKTWAYAVVYAIYQQAVTWQRPAPIIPGGLLSSSVSTSSTSLSNALPLCANHISARQTTKTLCGRVMRFLPELFTFIRFEGLTADNNAAERMVRDTVVATGDIGRDTIAQRPADESHPLFTVRYLAFARQKILRLEERRI